MLVFEDVVGYAGSDVTSFLVLTKIVHEIALWVHQVHDDGVVHLEKRPEGCWVSASAGWLTR